MRLFKRIAALLLSVSLLSGIGLSNFMFSNKTETAIASSSETENSLFVKVEIINLSPSWGSAEIVLSDINLNPKLGFNSDFYNDFINSGCLNDFPSGTTINDETKKIIIPFPLLAGTYQKYYYVPWYVESCTITLNGIPFCIPTTDVSTSDNNGLNFYFSFNGPKEAFFYNFGPILEKQYVELTKYSISTAVNPSSSGVATIHDYSLTEKTSESCIKRQKITLTATPIGSATFDHWEANGTTLEGKGATFDTYVSEDTTYTAVFTSSGMSAEEFATKFNTDLCEICNTTQTTGYNTTLGNKWTELSNDWGTLTDSDKTTVKENSNTIYTECRNRYSYILAKYHSAYSTVITDFMGLYTNSTIPSLSAVNVYGTINEDNNTVLIIIVISTSLLVLSSVATLVIIKKRKHQ